MANVRIEVVTPVHNRKELTLRCLESLMEADLTGIDLHVVVVDDGSTDGTSEALARSYPDVAVIRGDGNLWYTAGTNVGLKAALGNNPDYILAINNDSEFDPGFLQHLLETANAHPKSVVGGVLVSWDDKKRVFQVSPKWNVWWGGMRHWVKQTIDTLPKKAWEVELIVGNCVLFPAEAIRQVGFMDEKKLPQYGDAEYTPRMRKAGWKLFVDPRARVYCKPNDVPEKISKMSPSRMVSTMLFDPYHPHSLRRRLNMIVGSAPSKPQGYAAFVVFFVRVLLKRNIEGRWAQEQNEQPLSDLYKTTS